MVDEDPRADPGGEFDGLAALDVHSGQPGGAYGGELAALDDDAPVHRPLDEGDVGQRPFTVTNPPGTVTVAAHPDGRIERIELSPGAVRMTERELAEEIVVIAGLATQDAKSAQYETMLAGMRAHGHDDLATREFLQRDLELPTPEQAHARRAEVFATRYAGSHE